MEKNRYYSPPRMRVLGITEEECLLLLISAHEDEFDDDDSDKVKGENTDWWDENVWNKKWD